MELPKTWALYLAKLTINAGGADAITLWVLKDSATFEETEASLGAPKYTNETVEFHDAVQDIWFGGRIANNSAHATGGLGALRISDFAGDAGLKEVLKGK